MFFFALCVNLLKIAWENQVGRTLTHTHTHNTQNPVEWGSFFSFRSAPALSPFELASFCIHQAFHTLTHTYTLTHRVHSKKKWLPPFAPPPFGAHYTLGLSCLKIDKLILKLYKQRLSSLSLSPSPSLFLSLLTFIFYAPILPSLLPIPPTTD